MEQDPQNTKGPKGSIARTGLSNRLKVLEESYSSRAEALRAYGLAKTTYDKWLYEKSSPSLESIAKIAKAANVSLDWLAFGEEHGQLSSNQDIQKHHGLDNFDWFGLVLEMLGDCYRFCGHNPPPNNYVHDAADIYMATAEIKDHDERRRTIGIAVRLEARNIKPPETEIDKLHG